MTPDNLYLKQIQVGPMENFVYLIGDTKTCECLMVDPAWEVDRVLNIAEADDMKVIGGICTHYHYDHTNGVDELIAKTNGPVYINKLDVPYVTEAKSEFKQVDSEHKLKVGEVEINLLHTPGHTPGSQCLHVQNKLVSGDTLFINGCGRCDLPGGNAEQLFESLQNLKKLNAATQLMPGHNYAAVTVETLENILKTNPYYQCDSKEEFVNDRMG